MPQRVARYGNIRERVMQNRYPELVRLAKEYINLRRLSGMCPTINNVAAHEAAWKNLSKLMMGKTMARDLVLFLERLEVHEQMMQG